MIQVKDGSTVIRFVLVVMYIIEQVTQHLRRQHVIQIEEHQHAAMHESINNSETVVISLYNVVVPLEIPRNL